MAKEEFKEPGKIFVAGHRGMVGSALVRCLEQAGEGQLLTRTRSQLDLTRQQEVESFFVDEKINKNQYGLPGGSKGRGHQGEQ
jgi:GDP-L-fucose synthase